METSTTRTMHCKKPFGRCIKQLVTAASLLLSTAASANTVDLTWDVVDYAEKYKLMRDAGSGFEEVYLDTATSFSDAEVIVGEAYIYKVIGCLDNPDTGETLCESVAEYSEPYHHIWSLVPTALSASYIESLHGLLISWIGVSDALTYQVSRSVDNGENWNDNYYSGSETQFQDSDISNNDGAIYYRVRACNASECGSWTASPAE